MGLNFRCLFAWLLWFAGTAAAQTQPHRSVTDLTQQSHLGKAFSPATAGHLIEEIPLRPRPNARVLLINHDEFERLGIPTDSLDDGGFAREIISAFGLGPVPVDESATATTTGLATRYSESHPRLIDIQGDGRVVSLGDVVMRDPSHGNITSIFEVQAKGIETGLKPLSQSRQDNHGHGRESLRQAIEDALLADYLAENGVPTNRWLAVIDTGETIEHPDGGRERAALTVRGGNFFRLAHLYHARNDRKMLRELIEYLNRRLSHQLGRSQTLSMSQLYRQLVTRKANELADLYWARATHGAAAAIANVGLFELLDHGTVSTVDRAHREYTFHAWPGYGVETKAVLDHMYERQLLDLMKAASSPTQRAHLEAIPKGLHQELFNRRMAENALAHMGLARDDIHELMRHRRLAREVLTLLEAVREVGEKSSGWQKYPMGPHGEATVDKPARYNIFEALSQIVAVYASSNAVEIKVDQLLRAMNSLSPDPTDRLDAVRLLEAAAPIVDEALKGFDPAVRNEKVHLMAAEAQRINRPVDELVRAHVRAVAINLVDRIERKEDLTPIRAEIYAMMRRHRRRAGPHAAAAVAERLRSQEARAGLSVLLLSHTQENAVRIEELTDGAMDTLRVTLRGNPLQLDRPERYRMRFTLDGKAWLDAEPKHIDGSNTTFEIPLVDAPGDFQAAFFDVRTPQGRWWNNGGYNFGKGHEFVLASPMVDASLALMAQRKGLARPKTPSAAIQALKRPSRFRQIRRAIDRVEFSRRISWSRR